MSVASVIERSSALPPEQELLPVAHSSRWIDRVALTVPSLVAGLVTIWWFPWNRFLAAGDVTPFLRDGDAHELFDLWNHRASGAGSTSVASTRALEVLIIRITAILGGSEVVAQHVFYALVMGFAAFGAAYLSRAFVRAPLAVVAAGLLGSFNVFVLIHLPNPLTMIWLGLVGTLAGMLIRAARGAPVSAIKFGVVTLVASYLSLNPPLLATAVLTVGAVAVCGNLLVGAGGARRAWRFLARTAPWMIGLNLWWIVPTLLTTLGREGLEVSAVIRVEDWSWSHARNSIPNVVTFTADWGWVHREYMPYAQSLDAFPWTLSRWALPLLAVPAPWIVRGRRRVAAATFVVAGAVAVFFAKGLHWPFEGLNLWAYHHVPGLWLLRDPVSKVGGLLLLLMVVLAAMTVEFVLERCSAMAQWTARLAVAATAAVVCLALAFAYPLWSGRIGPDGRRGALPSARVAVPGAWHDLAATVNASSLPGKALVLPLDPYYQVTTDWGFHGADQLVSQLLHRPVLSLLPDGYFMPAGLTPEMLRGIERLLVARDGEAAAKLLQLLGVSHVILRSDLAAGQVVRAVTDRDAIAAGLGRTPGIAASRDFGVAELYELSDPVELVWVPDQVVGLARRDDTRTVSALAALAPGSAAVAPGAVPVDALSWEAPEGPSATVDFELRNGGVYDIGSAKNARTRYRVRLAEDDSGANLRVLDTVAITLDGEPVGNPVVATISLHDSDVAVVELGDELLRLEDGTVDVDISTSTLLRAYAETGVPEHGDHFGAVGDCGPRARGSRAPEARVIPNGRRIIASSGLGCVTLPGPALSPNGVYRVQFEYRVTGGSPARSCLWMNGPGRCASGMPTLEAGNDWTKLDTIVKIDPDTTGMVLYLYSDASNGSTVIADYRNIVMTTLEVVGKAQVTPARTHETRVLDPGDHRLTVDQSSTILPLAADSPLGDCQRQDDRTPEEAELSVEPIAEGVRLRASAHAACVTAGVPDDLARGEIALSMEVRTVRGRAAQVCLWQEGPDSCAELPSVPASPEWYPYRAEVTLAPGTTAARLYLYAYGDRSGTITEYRRIHAGAVAPEIVNVTPQTPVPETATVTWAQRGSGAFSATVDDINRPTFVVLDESYGDGWHADGIDAEIHTEVNGYANGWAITSVGDLDLNYSPNSSARLALHASLLIAALAIATATFRHGRRRRRRGSDPWDVVSS